MGKLVISDMKVGPAHTCADHLEESLAGTRTHDLLLREPHRPFAGGQLPKTNGRFWDDHTHVGFRLRLLVGLATIVEMYRQLDYGSSG